MGRNAEEVARKEKDKNAFFVDATGKKISDVAKIIADKRSTNAQERTFRCTIARKHII